LAREKKTTGQVFISFHLNNNKTISDIVKIKQLTNGCDDEVIRVFKNFKDTLNLKPANYSFSVDFKIIDANENEMPITGYIPNAHDVLKNYLFGLTASYLDRTVY